MTRHMTIWRAVAGLTVWLTLISVLWLTVFQHLAPASLEMPLAVIVLTAYPLMALRWGLVLTLLIRSVRARPLMLLPKWPVVQVSFVVVMQTVLGLLSLMGFLMIWINTLTAEHVMGVVLHLVIPAAAILSLSWRAVPIQARSGAHVGAESHDLKP